MIVVFGSVNLDLIVPVDRLPGAGETVLGPDVRLEPGGKGANQAVAAARDGAAVAMAGAVGRDGLADVALSTLIEAGVDLSRIARLETVTGCAAICTDPSGRNQIAVGAGANLRARADQVEDAVLVPNNTVLLQMECDPVETAALVRRARAGGCRVMLNLAPAAALPTDVLPMLDLLLVNEHEAEWLARHLGAGTDALHDALGVTVVRTLGERGADYAGAMGRGHVPAHPVVALDTTAAGDCFAGVLAAALDRGAPLDKAMRRASAAAGLCCTVQGSQGSLPQAAQTDAALMGDHRG